MVDPTDKSTLPAMTTSVAPSAVSSRMPAWPVIRVKFAGDRNELASIPKKMIMITSTIQRPAVRKRPSSAAS